jgi:triacylglycerol esterase/lipase EstA (alpha/beta hydrolase family)
MPRWMAVTLGAMSASEHVVLIHGNWGRGELWASARAAFEERGYTVHTPTLRHHDLPPNEGAMTIASLSLRDYTDDSVRLVNSLNSPPLLVGHSMGGLIARCGTRWPGGRGRWPWTGFSDDIAAQGIRGYVKHRDSEHMHRFRRAGDDIPRLHPEVHG